MVFGHLKRSRKTSAAAFKAASLAAVLLGSSQSLPAMAAEDTNTFNSFLGFFGMQFDKEQEAIDYRARAPLVIPPKTDLPPPQSVEARRPADWPTDPDVAARRKAMLDSHRPAPQITPNTRAELTKEELNAGRGPTVVESQPGEDSCSAQGGAFACLGSPWQYVKEKMGVAKPDEQVVLSGKEPDRKFLTEPPPGYRIPTAQTKVEPDRAKDKPDDGDAQAYTRREQTHRHSVDD